MAKRASVLRQFTVETVQYDGWMELAHNWRECDWTADIAGDRITDLMEQATAHAKLCDGKPQPRPEPRPLTPFELKMRELWQPLINATLSSWLMPSRGLRATVYNQDELLIPADQALTIERPHD